MDAGRCRSRVEGIIRRDRGRVLLHRSPATETAWVPGRGTGRVVLLVAPDPAVTAPIPALRNAPSGVARDGRLGWTCVPRLRLPRIGWLAGNPALVRASHANTPRRVRSRRAGEADGLLA